MTWSNIRHKLENDYLAESLRCHIQYYATSYSKCPDHEGRAAIRLDGTEILSGCYYNRWTKAAFFPKDEKYASRMRQEFAYMDDAAVQLGVFDQRCFYKAFELFESQSLQDSLHSENMLVRIFAILDRRVGKRTLVKLRETIVHEDKTFQEFFAIRVSAEGIDFQPDMHTPFPVCSKE